MIYLILKLLHIIFVVLFLGNIITAVFWKRYADKTGNPLIMAHGIRGVIKSDRLFTLPGVAGITIFGIGAMFNSGYSFSAPWVLWSIILFTISGIVFMALLVPIQKKMLAIAEAAEFNKEEYEKLSRQWELWGTVATLTPVIAVILMVVKPY